MQTWPSYQRSLAKLNNEITEGYYPLLDHGTLEAATLVERSGKFEWDSLVCSPSAVSKSRFRVANSFNIFPVTKPPPLPEPVTTINQRADQGAHFLRMHFPDVDVSADVIRNQIKEDTLQATELAEFDPFEGNVVDIATVRDKEKYLVFPTGELSSELNLTPFFVGDDGKVVIKSTATPARTFSTPIQQITSSPSLPMSEASQRDTLLSIRTFGATSLLKFDSEATTIGGVRDLTYFTSHELGGASIMDVKICPTAKPFDLLLVNKDGDIYGCSLAGGKKTMVKLYAGLDPSPKSPFWRIGRGANPTECTVLSGKNFSQLDFRSNELVPLYTASAKDFLTSIEDYSQDRLVRLCSTSQIIWIDLRYPEKPLVGYKHHRQFERTLHTSTLFVDSSSCTFLSSRRNGLLTVYNASRHDDHLVRVNDTPYGILTSGSFRRLTGQAFLEADPRIIIFQADQQASVDCIQLQCTTEDYESLHDTLILEESEAVKELRKKTMNMKTDLDIFGDQEKVLKNLFPAYDSIFRIYAEHQEQEEEDQAEAFYDIFDRLPTFWQMSDIPSEHMLTSYDIAFRSHEDYKMSSRSDFTTGCFINSARGFRAISQSRFPTEELRKGAPWHLNTTEIQNRIDCSLDLDSDAQILADSLHSYDLIHDDDRTALSTRRENNAREQLVVDLTLSQDIYSPSMFAPLREVENDLETMTEALSLGENDTDEPPQVEFRYLAPVTKTKGIKKGGDHDQRLEHEKVENEGCVDGRVSLPMGVRLLLKDWEVGSKTNDYIFQDPYGTVDNSTPRFGTHPALSRLPQINTIPSLSQAVNSQRPPTVIPSQDLSSSAGLASQSLPPVIRSQNPAIRSTSSTLTVDQNVMGISQLEASQSIDQFTGSTPVLPGLHGVRPKKKPAKKRLGGF